MRIWRAPRFGALAIGAVLLSGAAFAGGRGFAGNVERAPAAGSRIVFGEAQKAPAGGTAFTWARLDRQGRVEEVGVSVPAQYVWNPRVGSGPAEAFLSLKFPEEARASTYFNHFEAHWNPMGHPPAMYGHPHFDLHFYSIPESELWAVIGPDSHAPDADHLPPGYVYPGVHEVVPAMGVHAIDPADFTHDFTVTMVAGYWHGNMTFVEPMVTRDYLMSHPDFSVSVPRPRYLYRATRFPAAYHSRYNARSRSYEFTYTGFSDIGASPLLPE